MEERGDVGRVREEDREVVFCEGNGSVEGGGSGGVGWGERNWGEGGEEVGGGVGGE